jgi:hypothetical protein
MFSLLSWAAHILALQWYDMPGHCLLQHSKTGHYL